LKRPSSDIQVAKKWKIHNETWSDDLKAEWKPVLKWNYEGTMHSKRQKRFRLSKSHQWGRVSDDLKREKGRKREENWKQYKSWKTDRGPARCCRENL